MQGSAVDQNSLCVAPYGPMGSVGNLQPYTEDTGGHRLSTGDSTRNVAVPKPATWDDATREEDGGDDSVGLRQQNCQPILQQELPGML